MVTDPLLARLLKREAFLAAESPPHVPACACVVIDGIQQPHACQCLAAWLATANSRRYSST
eukprot:44187-Eustigmatos_ZCMA.PRE.1